MGLLTDPATGQGKPTRLLVKYHNPLCILLYFASLVWFALLAHTHFNAGTYFSENAMLPGLVKGEFELDSEAKNILSELEAEATQHSDSIPASWLLAKFTQLNLLAFSHNFTLNYPLGRGTKFSGRNVYGILRAARSSSMESLVLSVPYRPPSSAHLTTLPGVALMISLAKFARRQKYWAKDIIFLVTEHEQLGAQAWLEAYHGASCGQPGVLDPGDILGRGGSIQAALNLEVHASLVGHIDIKVCGLNGQLPNLDLVNLVHRMCAKEGVRHTFNKKEKIQNRDQFAAWLRSLETLMAMVTTQASGVPDGNHGLFHRFGIESVTLEGFEKRGRGSPATFYQLGRVLEGLFRSLNNLLERFHQSYFFYLLPDTDRYISIGLYMPCLGMLAGALFIKAFALWLKVQISKKESSDSDNATSVLPEVIMDPNLNIVAVGIVMLVAHSVGVGLLYAAQLFTKITALSTDAALFYGLLASSVITVVTPPIINIVYKIGDNWVVLNVLALLELGTVLLAVAMHNFSLAFVSAVVSVPPALWIQPSNNRWFKKLIWVLIHPFLLLFCAVLLSTKFNFSDAGIGELLMRALSANRQALVLSVVDAMIYGSWSFRVAVGLMLPNWLTFWFVCQSGKPKLAAIEKAKKDN